VSECIYCMRLCSSETRRRVKTLALCSFLYPVSSIQAQIVDCYIGLPLVYNCKYCTTAFVLVTPDVSEHLIVRGTLAAAHGSMPRLLQACMRSRRGDRILPSACLMCPQYTPCSIGMQSAEISVVARSDPPDISK